MLYFQAIAGYVFFLFVAYLFSSSRKSINYRLIIAGLILQFVLAVLLLKTPFFVEGFQFASRCFVKVLDFSLVGAQFLFGDLAKNSASGNVNHNLGFVFAFQVLPSIVFFSTLTAGLYYLGILQKVVFGMAWLMSKTMKISGAESISAVSNIFLGQTESPLLVKPFLAKMTKSEIMCVMTAGMATIAGGVMAAYIQFLGGNDTQSKIAFASYLLTASVINVPSSIVFAKILYPETKNIDKKLELNNENFGSNLLDALSIGATDGVKLAVGVGAMLLTFISLIALVNYGFEKMGAVTGLNEIINNNTAGVFSVLNMQYILGQICRPFAFFMGIPWHETLQVGSLLGEKTVINEFVSYLSLSEMKNAGTLSARSIYIATFALCGFSNFSSIAIQVGAMSVLAPNQRSTFSELGFRALLAASLACFMSGLWAGILLN
ncbi:MAG: NupC/NupG family nucleoside CNT transporter [Cytophagales bacterium]